MQSARRGGAWRHGKRPTGQEPEGVEGRELCAWFHVVARRRQAQPSGGLNNRMGFLVCAAHHLQRNQTAPLTACAPARWAVLKGMRAPKGMRPKPPRGSILDTLDS